MRHPGRLRTINPVVTLVVVELPRDVERVVRDEGERRVGVGVVAQLLQLEHVHRPVQRHFGPYSMRGSKVL